MGAIPESLVHSFTDCFVFLLSCIIKRGESIRQEKLLKKQIVAIMSNGLKLGEWQLYILVLGWSELSA